MKPTIEVETIEMRRSLTVVFEATIYYGSASCTVLPWSTSISDVFTSLAVELKLPYKRTGNRIEVGYAVKH